MLIFEEVKLYFILLYRNQKILYIFNVRIVCIKNLEKSLKLS